MSTRSAMPFAVLVQRHHASARITRIIGDVANLVPAYHLSGAEHDAGAASEFVCSNPLISGVADELEGCEAFGDLESIGNGAVRGHRSASLSGPIVIVAGDLPLAFNRETAGEAISGGPRVVHHDPADVHCLNTAGGAGAALLIPVPSNGLSPRRLHVIHLSPAPLRRHGATPAQARERNGAGGGQERTPASSGNRPRSGLAATQDASLGEQHAREGGNRRQRRVAGGGRLFSLVCAASQAARIGCGIL